MDPHALAVALDELAILPPSALTSIGTLRRVHASLVAAGAQGLHTAPTTDRTAPARGEDVARLHEIFDACASAGAPSTATHYVDEVCGDARVVSVMVVRHASRPSNVGLTRPTDRPTDRSR